MNNITVTVELGPESQAKLDKILEALQGFPAGRVENAVTLTAEPDQDTPKPKPKEAEHPADEVSPHGAPEPAEQPEEPKYTKQDVQALVQKLAAPTSPEAKRAGAKAIVKSYGTKISDIPEAKYGEVMDKLIALDKEG